VAASGGLSLFCPIFLDFAKNPSLGLETEPRGTGKGWERAKKDQNKRVISLILPVFPVVLFPKDHCKSSVGKVN
jgi:hypothetical protein